MAWKVYLFYHHHLFHSISHSGSGLGTAILSHPHPKHYRTMLSDDIASYSQWILEEQMVTVSGEEMGQDRTQIRPRKELGLVAEAPAKSEPFSWVQSTFTDQYHWQIWVDPWQLLGLTLGKRKKCSLNPRTFWYAETLSTGYRESYFDCCYITPSQVR